ncbi:N-acetyltransferase [Halopseudomonas sp.]|jgi:hypothetical protein|uniref:N-acetyltransferase n=1 Tax=Halopseudomonas sp. TaxID=2901191 RepID=UPI0039E59F7C
MRQRGNHYRYQIYRSVALQQAKELALNNSDLRNCGIDGTRILLEPINQKTIEDSLSWGDGASLYPWEDVPTWKNRDPKGIDIALWYDTELCGMAYASPRQSKLCIKIILLEGKPDVTHPLKGFVAPLVITAVESYAVLINCCEIEIEDPNPGAVEWYKSLGFEYGSSDRLVMAIQQ